MARSKRTEATVQAVIRQGEPAASQAGLGVDIIEIARMERALRRTPRFRQRVFSEGEREYAEKKSRPPVHYALFFAAREAVLKALGTGFAGMGYADVEVTHDRFGRPVPLLRGRAAALAEEQGVVEVQLSLSYTHQVGVASAVAIKASDRPRPDKRPDPTEELNARFKEMRALLDSMDARIREVEAGGQAQADASAADASHAADLSTGAPPTAGDLPAPLLAPADTLATGPSDTASDASPSAPVSSASFEKAETDENAH
jgi:holo-[acyl-carrier protein] synthase